MFLPFLCFCFIEKFLDLLQSIYSEQINLHKCYLLLSMSLRTLGIFGKPCKPFIDMNKEPEFHKQHTEFIVRKLSKISTKSKYYIFCMHNKPWSTSDLPIYYLLAGNFYTKIYIPYTVAFFLWCNFFLSKPILLHAS